MNCCASKYRFNEAVVPELSLPPFASSKEQQREDVARGSPRGSSTGFSKRHSGRSAITLIAFASGVAVLFLVSRCVTLISDDVPSRLERRLAGEQMAKQADRGDAVEGVCGEEQFKSAMDTHRRGGSVGPSGADTWTRWDEYGNEPPKKKRQEALDEQQETQNSPSHAVVSDHAETARAAEKLRQPILLYAEQRLAEKDDGSVEEHWLLEPTAEMQSLDEEEPMQSISTVVPATARASNTPANARVSAVARIWPKGCTRGNASAIEGSQKRSSLFSGVTSGSSDAQRSPQGALSLRPGQRSPAVESIDHPQTLLFEYTIGKPGSKGAYMLLGSEVASSQGRPALTIISTRLPTELAPREATREVDLSTHPFYKLPSVAPNASVREIVLKPWPLSRRRSSWQSRALLGIKELFKKPLLNSNDLERLMQHLEQFVEYAIYRVKENTSLLTPKYIVDSLGFSLLVTDAIFAASEVLGKQAKRSAWWPHVVDTLPVYMGPSASAASNARSKQNIVLARFLHSALEFYRCGSRPPASALVPLKQILLCTSAAPSFRRGPWAHFMADDTEWQQSQ